MGTDISARRQAVMPPTGTYINSGQPGVEDVHSTSFINKTQFDLSLQVDRVFT